MTRLSRRKAITGALATGACILSAASAGDAQTERAALAFRGTHTVRPLPFNPSKLTGISEKLILSHHENNYAGAVKGLNAVENALHVLGKDKNVTPSIYGTLKREELMRTGSMILHEAYFANLGGNGKADGNARKLIENWFGSFEAWEAEFKRTGIGLSGGSGWTILAFNTHTGELHNYWAGDHTAGVPFSVPLLVLDMYEHAYQMDYGAAAAKYVDAFMMNVNWEEVSRRVESLGK